MILDEYLRSDKTYEFWSVDRLKEYQWRLGRQ